MLIAALRTASYDWQDKERGDLSFLVGGLKCILARTLKRMSRPIMGTEEKKFNDLFFACECVSARRENYSDPWATIAKNRLIVDGTKERIINLVARKPRTISQLAKELSIAAP